ncbi:E1-E2 ATPase family protein [Cryptosporidium felis]|nr:E1-E2 ATPase family protein [Cryptosporidium felis]
MTGLCEPDFYLFPIQVCIRFLSLTILVFLFLYVVNSVIWRRYDRNICRHQNLETILIPCNRNVYYRLFRYTIDSITAIHFILVPLITYDALCAEESKSIEFWKKRAEVFLIEYFVTLVICIGRRLLAKRIELAFVFPSNIFDCNHVCVWIKSGPDAGESSKDFSERKPFDKKVVEIYRKVISFFDVEIKGFNYFFTKVIVDDASGIRYFIAGSTRYVFSEEKGAFLPQLQSTNVAVSQLKEILCNGGHSETSATTYLSVFGRNEFPFRTKPGIHIFKHIFFSPTFIIQYLMLSTTFFLRFLTWSICWSILILYTNLFCFFREILRNRKVAAEASMVNNRPVNVERGGRTRSVKASEVVLFDIVLLGSGDTAPCDMILVDHLVLVDESGLTGEATPVLKKPFDFSSFSNSQIISTGDRILQDSIIYSGCRIVKVFGNEINSEITSIALNTGVFTFKSRILDTASKVDDIPDDFHEDIPLLWLITLTIALIIIVIQCYISTFNIGSMFFILGTLMQLLPIWAPAFVQSCINTSASRLKKQFMIESSFPKRILFASKLNLLFLDKTGTLTQNCHILDRVENINTDLIQERGFLTGFNGNTNGAENNPISEEFTADKHGKIDILKMAISTCHSLYFDPDKRGEYFGDAIEKEMLRFTRSEVIEIPSSYGKSPKRFVVKRETEPINVSNKPCIEGCLEDRLSKGYEVLKLFDFNSFSRTMSVIAKCNTSNRVFLFVKGATESVLKSSVHQEIFLEIESRTCELSSIGSYVLLIAYRELRSDPESLSLYLSAKEEHRGALETELTPIGILSFSNSIRSEAPGVISSIKELGIRAVILTGDNSDCALSVATRVGIINKGTKAPVEDFGRHDNYISVNVPADERAILCCVVADKLVFLNESRNEVSIQDIFESLDKTKLVVTYEAFEMMRTIDLNGRFGLDGGDSACSKDKLVNKFTLQELLKNNISAISRANHVNKQSVVRQFMDEGNIVGMVGDGSNDVAAIKESNVGIFTNKNGNLNSHFSLNHGDLNGVFRIIQEGCGCAANSKSLYLFMIMYGFTLVICKNILLYTGQATIPTMGYFYYSILINFPSVWGIKQGRPAKKIKSFPVDSGLVTRNSILTVMYFVLVVGINLGFVMFFLSKKPWFISSYNKNTLIPIYLFARQDGFESSTTFIWMCSLHSHMALIFGFGGCHREPFYMNKWLLGTWVFSQLGLVYLVFSDPSIVTCFFKINCDESMTPGEFLGMNVPKFTGNNVFPFSWKLELLGWIISSFILCIFIHNRINNAKKVRI